MARDPYGSASANSAEWEEAWTSVRRLAEARQSVVQGGVARDAPAEGSGARPSRSAAPADPDADDIVFISTHAQNDLAEIESALAALRNGQPDLEAWSIPKAEVVQSQKPRSVWLIVGVVWISTIWLMAMAAFAIASLLS